MDSPPQELPETTSAPQIPPSVLRLWPGLLILAFQLYAIITSITPSVKNVVRFGSMMIGVMLSLVMFLVYWVVFSKASPREKLLIPLIIIGLPFIYGAISDPSVYVTMWSYGLPIFFLVIMLTAWLGMKLPAGTRFMMICGAMVLSWCWFPLVRLDGFDGVFLPEFRWRFSPTQEQRMINQQQQAQQPSKQINPNDFQEVPDQDWTCFRGANQRSISQVLNTNGSTDFKGLNEKWRIKVGPAWSAFICVGQYLFTQEQRGTRELVTCYAADSGAPIWEHAVESRFEEVVSGAGPRATPTYHQGKIYALGGMGDLSCLDVLTGQPVWQKNLMREYAAPKPQWGFSSSPLVYAGVVIVYVDGQDPGAGWVAFDALTGKEVWKVPADGMNYSSAYLMRYAGVEVLVMSTDTGWKFVEPATGQVVYSFKPEMWTQAPCVQPQLTSENLLIAPLGDGDATECYELSHQDQQWKCTLKWKTTKLRPSFNDMVESKGRLLGFNQNLFVGMNLQTGETSWKKKGRFGFGQVLLLEKLHLLAIQDETGPLILADATSDDLKEVARYEGLRGKTWNHLIAARGHLYLRNGEEAVCYAIQGN